MTRGEERETRIGCYNSHRCLLIDKSLIRHYLSYHVEGKGGAVPDREKC